MDDILWARYPCTHTDLTGDGKAFAVIFISEMRRDVNAGFSGFSDEDPWPTAV